MTAETLPPPAAVLGPGVYQLTDDEYCVRLTGGQDAIVDVADLPLVDRYQWRAKPGSNGKLYVVVKRRETTIYMHRLILGIAAGVRIDIDHRNNDGLDNRRANLRIASRSQNLANTGKRAGNFGSQYKGVSWDQTKWRARIKVGQVERVVGRFSSEVDAARAYDVAARAAWGTFAVLNFPWAAA